MSQHATEFNVDFSEKYLQTWLQTREFLGQVFEEMNWHKIGR